MNVSQADRSTFAVLSRLHQYLVHSEFVRSFLVVLSGTVMARAILILAMPLLARWYSPDAIGVWQLFVSFLAALSPVMTLRYEIAVTLPDTDEGAAGVFWLCLSISAVISLACVIPAYLYAEPVALAIGDQQLSRFLWLVPPLSMTLGIQQVCTYWLNRNGAFVATTHPIIVKSLAMVGIPIGIYCLTSADTQYLIAGTVIGNLVAALLLLWSIGHRNHTALRSGLSWKAIYSAAMQYRNYPIYIAPIGFVTQGAASLAYVLLAIYTTPRNVGLYAVAMQVTFLPVTFISQSLNQVFYPKLAREQDRERLQAFILQVLFQMVVFATPLAVLFAANAPDIFALLLGAQWKQAGIYAACLAGPSQMMLLTAWLNRMQHVAGRQRLELVMEATYSVVSILVLAVLLHSGVSPEFSVAAYCATTVIYNGIWLAVTFHVARFSIRSLLPTFSILLILAVLTFTACQSARYWFSPLAAAVIGTVSTLLIQLVAASLSVLSSKRSLSMSRLLWRWKSWKEMWDGETSPLFGIDAAEQLTSFADELKLLFHSETPERVLEIGCGNGALFPYLGFSKARRYRGVDFSSSMIEDFERRCPGTSLTVCEGEKYQDNDEYDLIFSNGVVQFFNPAMLDSHLQNAKKMLAPGGKLILGSVPWRVARYVYLRGELLGAARSGWLRYVRGSISEWRGNYMGRWYDHREIVKLANRNGLSVRFCGSLLHPYRFHAILEIKKVKEDAAAARSAA